MIIVNRKEKYMKCLFIKSELEDKVNSIDSLMNCEVRGIMNTLDLDINDFNSIVEKLSLIHI